MYLLSNIAIWISIKFQRNSSFIKSVSVVPCFSLFRAWKFNVKHNTSHSIYNTERAPTIHQHPAGIPHNLLQHVQKKHHKLNHKEIPQNIWSKKWGSSWILTPQEKLKKNTVPLAVLVVGFHGEKNTFNSHQQIHGKSLLTTPIAGPHLQYALFCWYPCVNYWLNP